MGPENLELAANDTLPGNFAVALTWNIGTGYFLLGSLLDGNTPLTFP
jgi:hypothetical protein